MAYHRYDPQFDSNRFYNQYYNVKIRNYRTSYIEPIPIRPNFDLFNINNNLKRSSPYGIYSLTDVQPTSYGYMKIIELIQNDAFKINKIERINNPFLMRSYMLKKEENFNVFGKVAEHLLFHGTKQSYLNNICKYNFNWRYCDRHKFGYGISFSPDAEYSMHYSDNCKHKIMIIAKVLISNMIDGHESMIVPPVGYDTSCKPNGDVIVKYEDNEFYPEFIMYYTYQEENNDTYDYYYGNQYGDASTTYRYNDSYT